MEEKKVKAAIDEVLHDRLFPAIKKIDLEVSKKRFCNSKNFQSMSIDEKKSALGDFYSKFYKSRERFYISLFSIFAVKFLCQREEQINKFNSEELSRVKVVYNVDGISFDATYPTTYTPQYEKEKEDCIFELKDPKYEHRVDAYLEIKDFQKSPPKPLTNAELKYSGFYLFNFEPQYTTHLANLLYEEELISNPNTNGWNIKDDYAEEIITFLHQHYPEEIILQHKRTYKQDKIDRSALAITPTHLEDTYFPKRLFASKEYLNIISKSNEKDAKAALKLYSYIFYLTLSTQLKDSVYDKSKLSIKVGKKVLLQEANTLMKGQENWEILLKSYLEKTKKDGLESEKEVILPKLKQGDVLTPLDVHSYSFDARRPPRYGVGRFLTQILEKYDIATNEEHDEIISDLLNSHSVIETGNILYPQEPVLGLVRWLKSNIPTFLDVEYLSELKGKIGQVCNDELSLDSLLLEINELIDAGFELSGYEDITEPPSEKKLKLVLSTAKRNGVTVSKEILASSSKCDKFLAQFPEKEKIKVGRCPKCNGVVYQIEHLKENGELYYSFTCENFNLYGGCNFSIWDSFVYKYFSTRAYELYTVDERRTTLQQILSKKQGYLFNGFKKKDTNKEYSGKIWLEEYKNAKSQKNEWGFQFKFAKRRK